MKKISVILILLCICLTRVTFAVKVKIDSDKMLNVDGQRVFILGLYSPRLDDANELKLLEESGFNLVSVSPNESEIAKVSEQGLWFWVNVHSALVSPDAEKRISAMKQLIDKIRHHPNFLVWEMPDEALWNVYLRNHEAKRWKEPKALREKITQITETQQKENLSAMLNKAVDFYKKGMWAEGEEIVNQIWSAIGEESPYAEFSMAQIEKHKEVEFEKVKTAYEMIKTLDPEHPIWMNHAPRNSMESLRKFSQTADIVGCDIYPVPIHPKLRHSDLMDQTMACVGAYTRRMQDIDPQKPVWMVIQGFDWAMLQGEVYERSGSEQSGFRPPTLEEIRFMGFDCIVNGSRGILFWGTHYVDRNLQLWKDLITFASEIKRLQPVLASEEAKEPLTVSCDEIFGSGDRGIVVLVKVYDGKPYILMVNEWHECGIRYRLNSPLLKDGMKFKEYYSGAEATIKESTLSYGIENFGVQVWEPVE